MAVPDPVTDVWELLWTAACDYRDTNPDGNRSEARMVDMLMPVVRRYAAGELLAAADLIDRGPTFAMPPSIFSALVRERADDLLEETS